MFPTLLYDPGFSLTVSQQGIPQGDIATQDWPARHDLGVVDYKTLTGLSLLWVPHFLARRGASLKDLNADTTSVSKAKRFPVGR
jgi:hypothetical protein